MDFSNTPSQEPTEGQSGPPLGEQDITELLNQVMASFGVGFSETDPETGETIDHRAGYADRQHKYLVERMDNHFVSLERAKTVGGMCSNPECKLAEETFVGVITGAQPGDDPEEVEFWGVGGSHVHLHVIDEHLNRRTSQMMSPDHARLLGSQLIEAANKVEAQSL
jgi:hypothetical protein